MLPDFDDLRPTTGVKKALGDIRFVSKKPQQQIGYRHLPRLLRELREEAKLTQRELGARLKKPQSWIYNCETANRRVDITEFALWATACGADPKKAFARVLAALAL